jgi:undecaprenyl-diphosphatase
MAETNEFVSRVQEADRIVFDKVASWHSPILDRVMPALSIAATYSLLWAAIALVLAVFGGRRGRRAAVEGMVTIGVTSLLANMVLKNLLPRRRPTDHVPKARRLEQPSSSSFPSGHSASAAAFAGIVPRTYPKLWFPLNALAEGVGFSRIYTGVHYPSDVLAGWMLGKAVAYVMSKVFARVPWLSDDAS